MSDAAIRVDGLDYVFPPGLTKSRFQPALAPTSKALSGLSFSLERGARCLLIGKNGAGKSTLLGILAGRHMTKTGAVEILGRPAFDDVALVHDVAFIGGRFPFDTDVTVTEILEKSECDPARRDVLVSVLSIDKGWHMHRVSDGQRRRVQLMLGLLKPKRVLLLDEATSDLDVIGRLDLLAFLRADAESIGTTILYATHVFDRLESWATHLLWLDGGTVKFVGTIDQALADVPAGNERLLQRVERWLRA
ncbi:MAG: ATP-binding cassette domain-containing protein [Deltaproteobacteria bacterium]|nr:ATP-binding cassette domain-containing protein [Deltaproteobacteria bacterium]